MVMESQMTKHRDETSGVLYHAPWNYRSFEDPSPDRYWRSNHSKRCWRQDQLHRAEAIFYQWSQCSTLVDMEGVLCHGLSVVSSLWSDTLVCIFFLFCLLLIPRVLQQCTSRQITCSSFVANKGIFTGVAWILQELCNIIVVWFGLLAYLFLLLLSPWFIGRVFTDSGRGYMTYKGWVVESISQRGRNFFLGHPDIMVIVIPHLVFIVLPVTLVAAALAAESAYYREILRTTIEKKEDDYGQQHKGTGKRDNRESRKSKIRLGNRWIRKFLLLVCLGIFWKHFSNCRVLAKAYEMNPFFHFPLYSFALPLLLAYAVYHTGRAH